MKVPDEIRKCVAFIGQRNQIDESFTYRGTCFFVGITYPDGFKTGYAVTAKHVIENISKTGSKEILTRYNLKNNKTVEVSTKFTDWAHHPDPTVDIAINYFKGFKPEMDHMALPISMFATDQVIKEEEIGIGEEVFITGLFKNHVGQAKNIPILRVGNIAGMPEEKVSAALGPMEAYLIEARSIGGLSGSPVFVNLGLIRNTTKAGVYMMTSHSPHYFLGLMHGHWDENSSKVDDIEKNETRQVNMGIGIVVPASKLLDFLNRPKIKAQRDKRHDEIAKNKRGQKK
jgi:hypothetical protein